MSGHGRIVLFSVTILINELTSFDVYQRFYLVYDMCDLCFMCRVVVDSARQWILAQTCTGFYLSSVYNTYGNCKWPVVER